MLKWNKKFGKILKTAADMRLAAMAIYTISTIIQTCRNEVSKLLLVYQMTILYVRVKTKMEILLLK